MAPKARSAKTDDSFFSTSIQGTKKKKKLPRQLKEAYTQCLADHAAGADACTPIAKAYLECRMERNLMARQDIAELGLDDEEEGEEKGPGSEGKGKAAGTGGEGSLQQQQQQQPRTKAGFVAGLRPSPKK